MVCMYGGCGDGEKGDGKSKFHSLRRSKKKSIHSYTINDPELELPEYFDNFIHSFIHSST